MILKAGASATRRVRLADLHAQLTCTLCKGYFIDATTIIECLHSFCRSCIVRYLAANKYCPVCDVQVHKTRPLLNIRADKILQDLVYKLVPRLHHVEMARRRDFYAANTNARPSPLEQRGEQLYQHLLTPEENVCVSLTYHGIDSGAEKTSARYLQCPAAVTIACLQKLIRNKYELTQRHRVDVFYEEDTLSADLTLVDVACIYVWRRKGPLPVTYRIYESVKQGWTVLGEEECQKDAGLAHEKNNNGEEGWKEVQLRISENGEMSVAGIRVEEKEQECAKQLLDALEGSGETSGEVAKVEKAPEASVSKETKRTKVEKQVKEKVGRKKDEKGPPPKLKPILGKTSNERKRKAKEVEGVLPAKKPHRGEEKKSDEVVSKPIILNHSAGLLNLSNNHPLKKHPLSTGSVATVAKSAKQEAKIKAASPIILNSKFGKNCPVSTADTVSGHLTPPITSLTTNYTPINVPSVQKLQSTSGSRAVPPAKPPMGYKTLSDPPKVWNPQLPRPEPKPIADMRNIRPAKFFKVRNNMPRYLGNPASGVKPMYAVQPTETSSEKTKEKEKEGKEEKKESKTATDTKKHSMVKIDPQTLRPIIEVPSTSSNSTNHELKINTSSVSIFKPLKERKSPHSPNMLAMGKQGRTAASPSPTNVSPSTSAGGAHMSPVVQPPAGLVITPASTPPTTLKNSQKAGLSFTPTNPFVPNLQSPTLSPNQFMFPQPGAFHSYDPMMAAYQSLMASYHRMPSYAKYDLHNLQQMGVYPLAGLMMNQGQAQKSLEERKERKSSAGSPGTPSKKARMDGGMPGGKEKELAGSSNSRVRYTSITITPKGPSTEGQKNREGKDIKKEKDEVESSNAKEGRGDAKMKGKLSVDGEKSSKRKDAEVNQKDKVPTPREEVHSTLHKEVKPLPASGKGEKSLQSALDKLTKAMKPIAVSSEERTTVNLLPLTKSAPKKKETPPVKLNNVKLEEETTAPSPKDSVKEKNSNEDLNKETNSKASVRKVEETTSVPVAHEDEKAEKAKDLTIQPSTEGARQTDPDRSQNKTSTSSEESKVDNLQVGSEKTVPDANKETPESQTCETTAPSTGSDLIVPIAASAACEDDKQLQTKTSSAEECDKRPSSGNKCDDVTTVVLTSVSSEAAPSREVPATPSLDSSTAISSNVTEGAISANT